MFARSYTRISRFNSIRSFSSTKILNEKYSCKVLVVGGGTGGLALTAKLSRTLNKSNLILLEPSNDHYYQPLFTLVGGGIEKMKDTKKNEEDLVPKDCTWLRDRAAQFDLKKNIVNTANGDKIEYEYLIVATGIIPRYELIPGLVESLENPNSGVCSVYSPKFVEGVFPVMQKLNSGNAIFTFPNSPVKCPGAPQKICYITEDYLRKEGKRTDVNVIYNTSLPVIFGVKRYADALWKICKERNINVNTRTNLVSVNGEKKEATFENLDKPGEKSVLPFSMLHVVPPMSTTEAINSNKDLTNAAGFVEVDKLTLQHVRFPNIFAIGDCSSSPNSKTAAAAAAQTNVVFENLKAVMKNQKLPLTYDGYASCPLVTGYNKCILAEFDYDLNPLETFPFRQDVERTTMFLLKKDVIPVIYWNLMMKGLWNGPALFRQIMHFGQNK